MTTEGAIFRGMQGHWDKLVRAGVPFKEPREELLNGSKYTRRGTNQDNTTKDSANADVARLELCNGADVRVYYYGRDRDKGEPHSDRWQEAVALLRINSDLPKAPHPCPSFGTYSTIFWVSEGKAPLSKIRVKWWVLCF